MNFSWIDIDVNPTKIREFKTRPDVVFEVGQTSQTVGQPQNSIGSTFRVWLGDTFTSDLLHC